MKLKTTFLILICLAVIFGCEPNPKEEKTKRAHIFLIYVDDLRPELGAYGNEWVVSPNIDALAADALVFQKAYANIPVCGASRASMLTGMYPSRNRFVGYLGNAEEEVPEAVTLPDHLKANGYRTLSFGKVFHTLTDSDDAWSEPPYRGPKQSNKDYALQENIDEDNTNGLRRAGFYERIDTVDDAYLDGKIPLAALPKLKESLQMDSSLFMGVGFWKPHLPFNAPIRYWDLYDRANLPYPSNYYPPEGAPEVSLHNFAELRSYTNIPDDEAPLDSALVREIIHGYYAATSYVDAQIGKFIQGLKDEGVYDESIIVLVGDHGWFLGEHELWCKHANYRDALRTTLMIKFPKSEKKGYSNLPVGLAELYPTLMEMIDLPNPEQVQAESFLSMLDASLDIMDEKEIYCRYEDGETIIKGKYAYTEYYNEEGELAGKMLYDHEEDIRENINIVDKVDSAVVSDLKSRLMTHINKYRQ